MANAFNKQETVAFEKVLEGFQDALVLSKLITKFETDATTMERSGDTIWRPQPYIAKSFDGMDQSSNFNDYTQLSVPATIGYHKSVPYQFTAKELNDAMQEGSLGKAAKQRLASDINVAVTSVVSNLGSLVVKRTGAPTGFDDVAAVDSVLNEQGIGMGSRNMAFSSRDYNAIAKDLATRATLTGKAQTAYEKAYVGEVSNIDVFKMDYANRLTAAAATGVTINGANQYYTPKATSTASTGETSNVDNRYQTIAITVTSGTVKVGDCLTIAGVNSVHHITKGDTGQLKTFRITRIVTGGGGTGTVEITPPIISGGGSTLAEQIYQNVTATPANGAAVTFLNTVAAPINPFWVSDCIELLPGRLTIPDGVGMAAMSATTDNGLQLVMIKQGSINDLKVKYRFDVRFGVVCTNTEMCGVELLNQS